MTAAAASGASSTTTSATNNLDRIRRQLEANLTILYKTTPTQDILLGTYSGTELKLTWDKPEGVPVNVTRVLVVLKDYAVGTSKVVLTKPFEGDVGEEKRLGALLEETGEMLRELFGKAVHASAGAVGVGGVGGEVRLELK